MSSADPAEPPPVRLRTIAWSVYAPAALFGLGQGVVAPVVVISAVELGASAVQSLLVAGAAGLGVMLGALPASRLVATIGERRALHLGTGLLVLALIGCIAAPNPWILGGAILVTGLSNAVWGLARHLFLTDVVPYGLRSRAMATLGGVNRAGVFGGPFLAAAALELSGSDAAYLLNALLAAGASVVLVVSRWQEQPANPSSIGGATLSVLQVVRENRRTFRTIGVGALLVNLVRSARQAVLPLWALHIGLEPSTATLVYGVSGALDMIIFYPAGAAMDRWGRRWISAVAMIILGSAFLVLPFARGLDMLLLAAVLMGLGNGLTTGLVLTLGSDAVPAAGREAFLGAFRLMADAGSFVGPILVSALAVVASLAGAIASVGAVAWATGGLLLRWVPRRPTAKSMINDDMPLEDAAVHTG